MKMSPLRLLLKAALPLLFVSSLSALAQTKNISGQLTSGDDDEALPGVSVYVKGNTAIGTITDMNGKFNLEVPSSATLVFSYVGYKTQELSAASASVFNVVMNSEETTLTDVVVVGSRNLNRSATDTAVPVDVLDMKTLSISVPQVNINQILNYVAPSFTSTTQTMADGTDHLDPASLRGLGPDQVLVLINGKRRHTSALVNVNGSVGRGSVGTDLNAIPTQAIKRIEVLRDGAAAQYGSDAIAGVINIVLKDQHDGLDLSLTGGANMGVNTNNFKGGADGEDVQLNANYGLPIGKNGGFINLTGSFYLRASGSRAGVNTNPIFKGYNAVEWQAYKANQDLFSLQDDLGKINEYAKKVPYFSDALKKNLETAANDKAAMQQLLNFDVTEDELATRGLTRGDFRMQVGQSALRSGQFFMNMVIPLNNGFELYAFGGLSYRRGKAGGFYRLPNSRNTVSGIYINGFLPYINSDVNDQSFAFGFRGKRREWNIDFSNTWGHNGFHYLIDNTLNASQLKSTNTVFNSGTLSYMQNTANLDVSRFFKDALQGVNVAFGGEYRIENYKIIAGEEASWATYYNDGTVSSGSITDATDFFGDLRPAGAQVFPGFKPSNARDSYRQSVAGYLDVEADLSRKVLLEGAIRGEHYNDFGRTINGKLALRVKITDNITFRIAGNTGFRAPSLHQLNFNSISSRLINGVRHEVANLSNDSRLAKLLGIKPLAAENSYSGSAGLTFGIPQIGMKITVDGYYTRINNRITLTELFTRPATTTTPAEVEIQRLFDAANATAANFFANSIDIDSKGVEGVINQTNEFAENFTLTNNLAVSWIQTRQIGAVHTPKSIADAGLTGKFFGFSAKTLIETAMPNIKGNLSHELVYRKWSFFLRNSYFGEVNDPNTYTVNGKTVYTSYRNKVLTDFSVGYSFTKGITLTIGANNIADIYPDQTPIPLNNGNQFVYPRGPSQFGFNGRYVFGRLTVSL